MLRLAGAVQWLRGTCISAATVKMSTGGREAEGDVGESVVVKPSFTEPLGESAKEVAGGGEDTEPEGSVEMEVPVPHNVCAKMDTHSAS